SEITEAARILEITEVVQILEITEAVRILEITEAVRILEMAAVRILEIRYGRLYGVMSSLAIH
ncbi:hypothetical protein, partial [Paenibacillus sp. N3.4]|uniref:hypothetical protein n=1 Tax=Paenibacillus sp. N3.4 TaxID=2603222 RepID=UPI001650A3C2